DAISMTLDYGWRRVSTLREQWGKPVNSGGFFLWAPPSPIYGANMEKQKNICTRQKRCNPPKRNRKLRFHKAADCVSLFLLLFNRGILPLSSWWKKLKFFRMFLKRWCLPMRAVISFRVWPKNGHHTTRVNHFCLSCEVESSSMTDAS